MHLLWYRLLTDMQRAFVGLRLPFSRKSDFVLFLSKIYKISFRLLWLLLSSDFIYFSLSSCLILSYFASSFSELLPSFSSSPFTPPFSSQD